MDNSLAEKNRRVLVIDDNRSIHDDFRKILCPAGAMAAALDATEAAMFGHSTEVVAQNQFEVDSAYQGQEGVLLVKKALEAGLPYAMAFVDVRMPPGWDGVETTRKIWELDPDLQIVICTAYSDYSWSEMFERLGHRDGLLILKKPFDAVEALQLAHALTEKWGLHQQSRRKMEELESGVAERTRELQQINHTLQTEVVEHQRAERTLRESEEKFRQLAENIADVFWMTSPDMQKIHYVSPAYERIWGRSVESLYANPHQWADAILPEDRERVWTTFGRLAKAEASVSAEFRIALPDGAVRWIFSRGFVVRDTAGMVIRRTGIATDTTERKQIEETLQLLSSAVEQSKESIVITDTELDLPGPRIVFVNPAFTKMTGYTAVEALGQTPRILQGPHSDRAVLRRLRETLSRGDTFEGETINYRKNGTEFHMEWQIAPIRNANGKTTHFVALQRDITERKHAEAALKNSEARTKAIVHSSLDCIVTIDHEGKILDFNPAAEKVFGYARAEVLGRELAQVIIPPSLRERHRHGMMRYLTTGEARVIGKRIEIVAIRSDGREFPVELAITRIGAEALPTFTGFIRDISERKRAERQLNIQYAISHALAESSSAEQATPKILQVMCDNFGWDVSGLWSVDSREGVLRCAEIWSAPNIPLDEFKAASRQLTFAHNVGLPGRVWASGQPAWIADVAQDGNFPRALAAKQAGLHAAFAFPILIGCRVSSVIEIFSREVREPDEDLLRTLAVLGSQLGQFFQRRQLEDQLFQSQKLETVGKLAGGIAHDFNSILTAILGQSELLLGDLPAGSPLARSATEINKAAGRAATLTRQILAYGRKAFLRPESLDLNQVIVSMEGMFCDLMGDDVDVRIDPAEGLRAVKADAGQIEQVIMNVAINAREAMPNGGKLTLETSNVSFDQESVGRYPELKPGDYVMLAITDTGTGMSEEVKTRVFEPFFTTKGVGQGTGLGLSTCYGIIKQSGGHISVYSEPGRGTTFKIYLPQVELQKKIPIQRLDSPDLPRGTETILLAEDDPALREMAATLLRRLGYTVLTAANGVEALSLNHQRDTGHIDLLFTDVVMPHMSGKELADRVRALYPHTQILFTSAYTENAIVHQGVLDQGVALLQKPFTPSALALKVREVLDQPGARKPDTTQKTFGFAKISDDVKTPGN